MSRFDLTKFSVRSSLCFAERPFQKVCGQIDYIATSSPASIVLSLMALNRNLLQKVFSRFTSNPNDCDRCLWQPLSTTCQIVTIMMALLHPLRFK